MNTRIRTTIACLAAAALAIAASSKSVNRLTPRRVAELTATGDDHKIKGLKVAVSGLEMPSPNNYTPANLTRSSDGAPISVPVPSDKPVLIECIRELKFPAKFEPPKVSADGAALTAPLMPASFETVNLGWTIHLSAKPQGRLVAISGTADYVTAEFVPGGYGPVAGPIFSEDGQYLSPNKLEQPKVQTTTTHFNIFAAPGEPNEVTFYRGAKSEKHTIMVTIE